MDRYGVNQFASLKFGEKSTYGWRVFDRLHQNTVTPLVAVFPTEALAQSIADLLNSANPYPFDLSDRSAL